VPLTNRIRATAPIRICDNGGWTDTWVARHGKVFNIAVHPLVEVQLDVFPRGAHDAHVILNAENYGSRYAPAMDSDTWGAHPLLEAALRAIPPPDHQDVDAVIRSKAPAGASTGTSAAVVVAFLGALDRLAICASKASQAAPIEIARLAHDVETRWLGRQSGVQDQLCAAFGGVNFIEITKYPEASVSRVNLSGDTFRELNRRLVLIFLGRPHSSSEVHEKVIADLERRGPDCEELNRLRAAAERARDAAVAGNLEALGRAMRENTDAQATLHTDLVQRDAWRIIEIAAAHGAAGWKVNGAGGDGGSITLLADPNDDAKRNMIRNIELEDPAFQSIPVEISAAGLTVW